MRLFMIGGLSDVLPRIAGTSFGCCCSCSSV